MSRKIRECIKGITKNKNVEELLPEYIEQAMVFNNSYARLKLMMEYYMYYEMISEGINPYIDSARDTTDIFNSVIKEFFEEKPSEVRKQELLNELLSLRQEVIDKMQVLTAYVDCFVVYEYILNRIQYRFEDMELLPDDTAFVQDVVNFIFGSKDNVAINDNIHCVIGQLPMRMSRTRYFDIIKESVSIYKGGDLSSLEGFAYMFRTNAMLYKSEDMDKYFTEFKPVLDELFKLDYDNMDKELFDIYSEKIRVSASKLNDISDLYMQLGGLINSAYTIIAASEYSNEVEVSDTMIRGINALFMERESAVWSLAGEELYSDEDKLAWLGELFPEIEGKQESVSEGLNMVNAVLEEIAEGQKELIEKLGATDKIVLLKQMAQLNSNSIFAGLEDGTEEVQVTAAMADEMSAQLIDEIKTLFKGSSRMFRRAVMANTIEKMPVFFKTSQEVADYITSSLGQCDDEAEKYASKQLIIEMMS